jgi:hypothetical protein
MGWGPVRAVSGANGSGVHYARFGRGEQEVLAFEDKRLEREILGSCLLRPHFLLDTNLTDDDFTSDAHRIIWRSSSRTKARSTRFGFASRSKSKARSRALAVTHTCSS